KFAAVDEGEEEVFVGLFFGGFGAGHVGQDGEGVFGGVDFEGFDVLQAVGVVADALEHFGEIAAGFGVFEDVFEIGVGGGIGDFGADAHGGGADGRGAAGHFGLYQLAR